MPQNADIPPGTLHILILKTLRPGPLHGYAIAQRIHLISDDVLRVEEGSLYPALQRMLLKGWVTAEPEVYQPVSGGWGGKGAPTYAWPPPTR
jgi:DNA-binding PadR family transcriptional regulator